MYSSLGVFATLVATLFSATSPESPLPQVQAQLPRMIEATWSAGQHRPQGMQDNHVNLLDRWLITALGFCSGTDNDWKPGKYPRGFLNKVWGLDLDHTEKGWVSLPDFPGVPRQGAHGARVEGALYLWGGFSYDAPYTYADGYCLSHKDGTWTWAPLPPLPSPTTWAGTCALGTKIFCLGGADYDAQRFYTKQDRSGKVEGLGRRLIAFDTQKPEAGWIARKSCPGASRCLTAMTVVDGFIYVIGGVSILDSGGYANAVDAWRYDPKSDSWERLRDLPMSGSGACSSLIVYKNRYILLPCGYQYGVIVKADGTEGTSYGTPERVTRTWKSHPKFETTRYFNHFYVYDTRTNLYGTATSLPFDDVATPTVVDGDTAYMFPGETGGFVWKDEYFGHHPEFVLKGQLRELRWTP